MRSPARPGSTRSSTSTRARPTRPPAPSTLPPEQHLLDGVQVVTDNGVEVLVPPLHHAVVTAKVADRRSRRGAHASSRSALAELEAQYPATPAGLGITVAWGLPYFRAHVPAQWDAAAARRRPSAVAGAARRGPLLERSRGDRARAERRRDPPAQRQRARDRDGREDAVRRPRRRSRRPPSAAASRAEGCRASSPSQPAYPAPT